MAEQKVAKAIKYWIR